MATKVIRTRAHRAIFLPRWAVPSGGHRLLAAGFTAAVVFASLPASSADNNNSTGVLEEVVVTATREAIALSKVPVSVSAFTQEQLQSRGLKEFDDITRFVPDLNLNKSAVGQNDISIRGISSSAGAATTGVYIDDVPIQVRQVGYSAGTFFPSLFDLDRVEVLRGPQGTLFGSGSEGGTVRFIQPNPNFSKFSAHARVEGADTRGGDASYEAGVAAGGPVFTDRLAVRASAYYRRDGGYIDRITGQGFVIDPTAVSGPGSMGFGQTALNYANSNWTETTSARFALALRPTDELTITASVNYQNLYLHDNIGSVWAPTTNARKDQFRTPIFLAGDPGLRLPDGSAYLEPIVAPTYDAGHDRMTLPYMTAEWSGQNLTLVSTTSYLERKHHQYTDATLGYGYAYLRFDVPRPGDKGIDDLSDRQRNFTQEVRVQSPHAGEQLQWVVGVFYSDNRQTSFETESENFLQLAPALFGVTADDPPFPGTSSFLNNFGVPDLPNVTSYLSQTSTDETQTAGFAQVDFKLTPQLTMTLGGRYSANRLNAVVRQDGPENNLNAPYGADCPTAGGCTPGEGAFAPVYAGATLRDDEKVFTPKVALSWQANPNDLYYASVSKGFRPGGAQVSLPAVCNDQLVAFGFKDADGNAVSPNSYRSDSVWSYELGSKDRFADGLLSVDASAYLIKWDNIQTNLALPDCGYNLVANLGKATSKGVDATVGVQPIRDLSFQLAFGYNSTTFDVTTPESNKGDHVPGTGSPWKVAVSAEYARSFGDNWQYYARGDFTYQSIPPLTGVYLPTSPSYNSLSIRPPATQITNIRLGARFQRYDLSLYVNNLFNFDEPLGVNNTRHSVLFTESFFRPRTVGITLSATL